MGIKNSMQLLAIAAMLTATTIVALGTHPAAHVEKVWSLTTYESCTDDSVDQDDCDAPPPGPGPAGSWHDPSDIGTETFTPVPPRIHDPSDIGTETFTPVYTPTPPPPPPTSQAPPMLNPCLLPNNPVCAQN
jgi:hypothetical protein